MHYHKAKKLIIDCVMSDEHTKSKLELLSIVEDEAVISQSALSKRLGIAAGLVNFLMKRAVSKGLVVVKRVPARRYAYFLTPRGFAEKTRLVADYMNTSLRIFRELRRDFDEIFASLSGGGVSRVIVVGNIELAELVLLACFNSTVDIVSVVCAKTNRTTLGPAPVVSHIDLIEDIAVNDVFIVADIYNAQEVFDDLVDRFGAEFVYAPKSLHITHRLDEASSKMRGDLR